MIKRIVLICFMFCMSISLVACSDNQPTDEYFYKNEYIALNDYRDEIFDFYQFEVTDEDLQMYVNYYILLPNATYEEVTEGTVVNEDYIHIFVKTTNADGKVIEQYTTGENGYFLYVGLNDYMDGLDKEVLGMKIGETKTFETVLNVNETKTPVTVEVSVDYKQITHFPEASDKLAEKAGYSSLQAFKDEYKSQLEEEFAQESYSVFLETVKKATIAEVYSYPEDMIQSYVEKYKESLAYFSAEYKMSEDEYLQQFSRMTREEWEAQVTEQAKDDVETELMLTAILEAYGLSLDEETYNYYLEALAQRYDYANGEDFLLAMEEQGASANLTRELTMNYGYDILMLTTKTRLIDWNTGNVIVDYVEENSDKDQ